MKTLTGRPDELDGFMGFVETHQKHLNAKTLYTTEHATVEDMFAMLVEYEMKIPAADQVRLDDLNDARGLFLESMALGVDFVDAKKPEMMKERFLLCLWKKHFSQNIPVE